MDPTADPFDDLSRLQLTEQIAPVVKASRRRRSPNRTFIKGPVPFPWLAAAGALPGRALHVGVALWFRVGLEQSREVLLPLQDLASMGVNRHAARRGLAALEKAGLVSVIRHSGRKPRVTVLDCPEDVQQDDAGLAGETRKE